MGETPAVTLPGSPGASPAGSQGVFNTRLPSSDPTRTRSRPQAGAAAGGRIQPEVNNNVLILFIFIITFNLEQVIQISI